MKSVEIVAKTQRPSESQLPVFRVDIELERQRSVDSPVPKKQARHDDLECAVACDTQLEHGMAGLLDMPLDLDLSGINYDATARRNAGVCSLSARVPRSQPQPQLRMHSFGLRSHSFSNPASELFIIAEMKRKFGTDRTAVCSLAVWSDRLL
ncbi:hypothetical protein FVE85_3689 [Porphyridium purpureum]|uniref:Uncharacterized protein n=1 Tax=Porphyridium purpureum TaxID=35688 RepID=A0A5J4YL90_PORPP|nr:hypothetical protein FVE85_3689 [Porphyridium purpureum]|eukprot:POR0448..scf249_10